MRPGLLATVAMVVLLCSAVEAAEDPAGAAGGPGDGGPEMTGLIRETAEIDGVERTWLVYLPATLPRDTAAPVWVQFHGVAQEASTEIERLRAVADDAGFALLAPQSRYPDPPWMWSPDDRAVEVSRGNPDVQLVETALERLAVGRAIDPARVYVSGVSAGAEAALLSACALPDRFAAVAAVSGLTDVAAVCGATSTPAVVLHGTDDPIVLYEGGVGERIAGDVMANGEPFGELPVVRQLWQRSIPERAARLACRVGCSPPAVDEPVPDVERRSWSGDGAGQVRTIDLYSIAGGTHEWPRQPIDATRVILEFFARHQLD